MRPPGSPRTGVPGRLHREAAGERPPRARPQRRGSPGPIPNPAVKPAFAESTAARGCGRAGRRARGGRFSIAPFERRPPTGRRSPLPGRARGCAPAEAGDVRRVRRERPAGGIALRAFLCLGPLNRAGTLRFRGAGSLHRRRVLAASHGKPSKSLLRSRTRSNCRWPRTADGRVSRPMKGYRGDASLAGPSRVLSRLRHRRAAACALSRRGALRGRSCSRGALEVPCRTRCGLSCIIGCLTIRRWLGLRCLGALRYRKDCALDIRRYDAGAMCRVFRRYVGVYAPSS